MGLTILSVCVVCDVVLVKSSLNLFFPPALTEANVTGWRAAAAARRCAPQKDTRTRENADEIFFRLVPVDTDIFPFPFYDFGHTHSLDHERVLIDDVIRRICI